MGLKKLVSAKVSEPSLLLYKYMKTLKLLPLLLLITCINTAYAEDSKAIVPYEPPVHTVREIKFYKISKDSLELRNFAEDKTILAIHSAKLPKEARLPGFEAKESGFSERVIKPKKSHRVLVKGNKGSQVGPFSLIVNGDGRVEVIDFYSGHVIDAIEPISAAPLKEFLISTVGRDIRIQIVHVGGAMQTQYLSVKVNPKDNKDWDLVLIPETKIVDCSSMLQQ